MVKINEYKEKTKHLTIVEADIRYDKERNKKEYCGAIIYLRFDGDELNSDEINSFFIIAGNVDYSEKYMVLHKIGYAMHEHLLRMFGV